MKNKKTNRKFVTFFIFLGLIILALRNVLFKPGLIGFTWDWDVPPFWGQILTKMQTFLYAWLDVPTLGSTQKIASPFYYWLVIFPFGLMGGGILIKFALLIILFLSGISMFVLSRELKISYWVSFIPACFYMFSPVAYSRIIAGHLPIAFGYALLPLFAAYIIKCFQKNYGFVKNIILSGILFSVVSEHPMLMGVSFVILVVFTVMELVGNTQISKLRILAVPFFAISIFILLHCFWLIPFVIKIFEKEQISHGGLSYALGKITLHNELPLRFAYLRSCSVQLIDSLRLLARQGMDVEFAYPVRGWIYPFWVFSSCLIPIFVFSTSFSSDRFKDRRYLSFLIVAILGVTLTSGVKTPHGYLIYYGVLKHLGWIFGEFSNANRWSTLIAISYAVLLGYFFDSINMFMAQKTSQKKVVFWCVLPVMLFVYPFWSGNIDKRLLKGSQPLSLLTTKINTQDKKVYDFLRKETGDFRVSYLPPAMLSYVGKPELSYEWTSFYSPKPEFMGLSHAGEPFSQFCVSTFFQKSLKTDHLGKILGLASLKYIVFPKYKNYYLYVPIDGLESAELGEIAYRSDGRLENALKYQKDIIESNKLTKIDTVRLYENRNWLPHIYAFRDLAIVSGDFSSFIPLSFLKSFEFKNKGLIFAADLDKYRLNNWQPLVTRYIFINNNYLGFIFPFIEDKYRVFPGNFALGHTDAGKQWVNMGFYWYDNWYHATSLVKPNGIFTRVESSFSIPYFVSRGGSYEIYALVHKYTAASKLKFYLDKTHIADIDTYAINDLGFKWVYVGDKHLKTGEHSLSIDSLKGENAVLELVLVPSEAMDNERSNLYRLVADKAVTIVNELEEYKEGVVDYSASHGLSVKPPVKGAIFVPKEGEYEVSLSSAAKTAAKIKITLGNNSKFLNVVVSKDQIYTQKSFTVHLEQGFNNFEITSNRGDVLLDILSAESVTMSLRNTNLNEPKLFEYQKINPTRYRINVDTDFPFFIFFSEAFNSKWRANIGNNSAPHTKGYGFGNLYYIDKVGDYAIDLEYADQKYFKIGQVVTLASWVVLLFLLAFFSFSKRTR